ncbi:MAG: PA2169 family four-helix-bundle protein [Bacteroidia bacterium]|jgi:uncharacterized protein (TIGR02284 family)|nr:PA2169 family four-helix-bundle protein [Bacteroidia bacterium]
MEKEKTIEVLNTLIIINNDRIEGYETAAKETNEYDLKNLFSQLASNSRRFKQELTSEVTKLGGQAEEGTKTTGKFFRVWMDVKSALTGNDRKAILSSCEFGEDHAVQTYKDVLRNNLSDITAVQQTLINAQYALIKTDHDKVKNMRDSLQEHN